ncbi:uncharacterized protein PV09_01773 [Verruconis gallopava]|uniref:Uncharacterized protein n=1 Tax=Verruconis gallopava TaxID=253628 RepID=A0A0D2AM70_9PEZI|nr:uncharacterized protein PV09_01773 [Verruconis gallopava]KIW07858.1 hypothetical protein PV09_01773 [Verruconis gallopava]
MALSEATLDPSTPDLINLRKILEACIYVPDISDATQSAGLSREQRFCLALDRFESTTRVFDQSYYESEVLQIGTTEDELDNKLRREARQVGVAESHFPVVKRRRTHRSSRHLSHLRQSTQTIDSTVDHKTSTSSSDPSARSSLQPSSLRASISSRPSVSAPPSDRTTARHSTSASNNTHDPTPATSVVSLNSTSSQSSSFSNRIFGKRRDSRHSLTQFFRRGSSSRPSGTRADNLPTDTSLQYSENNSNHGTIAEEPNLASPNSHESQDMSSIQSLSISSRTSISSFGEQQPHQDISGVDKECLESFMQTKAFRQLQALCEEEMHRFNSFATDQHIALPLILGRNYLYSKERKQTKLAELRKEHEAEIEKMEDRHADKELSLREIHRAAMDDKAVRNSTAIKHVTSRIASLGDEATPEHHLRLEEEQSALKRLAKKHEAEMRNLVRYQEGKKLELLRKQEKDLEELSKSLDKSLENQRKEKAAKLHHNISRLDDLVEERRSKLVARFFLRLQILKAMTSETAKIESALPLSILGLPPAFTASLGYS